MFRGLREADGTFTAEDRAHIQGVLIERARRCQRCGEHPDDWDNGKGLPKRPPPLLAKRRKCYSCVARSSERKAIQDADGWDPEATIVTWHENTEELRRERAEAAERAQEAQERKAWAEASG